MDEKAVKIYSTKQCPYCVRAKAWCESRNIEYDEIILDNQEAIGQYRTDCPGKATVPQILVNGELIGGHDELMEKRDYVLGKLKL